jgi:hypothetical protein
MTKFLFPFSLTLLFACGNPGERTQAPIISEKMDSYQYIEDEELLQDWLSLLEKSIHQKQLSEEHRELTPNIHTPGEMDTIKTYVSSDSKIQIYAAQSGFSDILVADLGELGKIRVGSAKSQVEQILGITILSEWIRIGGEEQLQVFDLYFEQEKVSRILFETRFE